MSTFSRMRATATGLAVLLAISCLQTRAEQPVYFTPGDVDGVKLLPPPPEPGSEEQKFDLDAARAIFKSRTPEQEAAALSSARLSMYIFAPAIGDYFKPGSVPKTEALFDAIKKQISGAVDGSKSYWNRQRPYQVDPSMVIGRQERNASYPSGHSTRGTVYSLLFAELVPEKREAILKVGRQIGWDRIVIGKHYPTDVFAGRVLGQAIFRQLQTNPEFQKAAKEAREEILAAKKEMAAVEQTEHAVLAK